MSLDAASGTNLGSAYGRIVFSSNAEEVMRGASQNLQNGLQSAGQSVTRLGGQMTLALAPVTAFVTGGVLAFANFDQKLTEIAARTGATADEMETVRQTAMGMGQATAFSATQAADAMLQLLSSGYNMDETMTALAPVLDLAAAGMIDLGFASDAVTDVLAQFRLGADDAAVVSDALARAAGSSSATVTDLIQGFANVGPLAANFGMSVEETAAVLATFSENGIKGAEAGTQLKSMLTNMTRDTDDVQGMWSQLGISMYDAMGNARPLNDVILDLNRALDGATDERRNQVIMTLAGSFGQMGLAALLASDGITPMQQAMANAADASTVADAQMSSFKGSVNQLKSSMETFSIQVLGPLIENYLKPLIQTVTQVLNKMTAWAVANPALAGKIGMVLAVLGGLGPTLVVVGKAMTLLGGAFAALFSPIGLIIGAVVALYAAWRTNFLGIQDVIRPIINNIINGFSRLIWSIRLFISDIQDFGIIEAIKAAFGLSDEAGGESWIEGVLVSFGIARETAINMVAWMIDALRTLKDFVLLQVIPAIQDFGNLLGRIWDVVAPALLSVLNWFIGTGLPAVVGFITGTVIPAIGWLIDTLKGIWEKAGPEVLLFVGTAVTIFTVLTQILGGVGTALAVLGPIISGIGVAFAALLSPIGLAALAGAALVTAYTTNFMGIRDFIDNEVFPRLKTFFEWLGGVWENTIKPGVEDMREWFVTTGLPAIKNFITDVFIPGFQMLVDIISGIWGVVGPALGDLFNWFINTGLPAIKNFIVDVFIPGFQMLVDIISGIWGVVSPGVTAFVNGLQEKFNWLKTNVIDPIITAIGGIGGAVQDAIGAINDVGEFVGGIDDALGGQVKVFGVNVNPLARDFDSGGRIGANEMALIGTGAQPEAFIPSTSGTMVPNFDEVLAQAGRGVQIASVQINANSYAGGQAAARGFVEEVELLIQQRDLD